MKKIFNWTLLSVLCFFNSVNAATLQQAEDLFEKGQFIEALKQYDELAKQQNSQDATYQINLRQVACQAGNGEIYNATKTLFALPIPNDALWKSRFLLYKIALAKNILTSPLQEEHEILSDEAKNNIEKWTSAQWHTSIDNDFRQLWSVKEQLANAPLENEKIILDINENLDFKRFPTLFDFMVKEWTEYLQEYSTQTPNPLDNKTEIQKLDVDPNKVATTKLIAQILKQAYTLDGKNRDNAKLFWQTQYILLSKTIDDNRSLIEIPATPNPQYDDIINQLSELSGFVASKSKIKSLYNKFFSIDTTYAKSYASYQLAKLLKETGKYQQAYDVCQYAKDSLGKSSFVKQCESIQKELSTINLDVWSVEQPLNRTAPEFSLTGKNLTDIYVRIYKTSKQELKNLEEKNKSKYRFIYNHNSSKYNYLFNLDSFDPDNENISFFLNKSSSYDLKFPVEAKGLNEHQEAKITLPALEEGLYVVFASPKPTFEKNSLGTIINATDIGLFVSSAIEDNPTKYISLRDVPSERYNPNVFHLYAFDLKTGEPIPNLSLEIDSHSSKSTLFGSTNGNGQFNLAKPIYTNSSSKNSYYDFRVLADNKRSIAFTHLESFRFSPQDPVKLFVQTDRSIYRPAQMVQFSINAFENSSNGLKTLNNESVKIVVRDTNWQEIFTNTYTLNAMGTATASFKLPTTAPLGNYSIQATLKTNTQTFSDSHNFSVEEFKRPDYKLELDKTTQEANYNKPLTVTGKATYFTGSPLQNSKISYTIIRKPFMPLWAWWRHFSNEEKIIKQSETFTNEKGDFSISFVPEKETKDENFADYVVKATVQDDSGRSIDASSTYTVAEKPYLFNLELLQGFYDSNKPLDLAKIDLVNTAGISQSSKVVATISLLENNTPQEIIIFNYNINASIEDYYHESKVKKEVYETTVNCSKDKAQYLQIPALPEGIYQIELKHPQAEARKGFFLVVDEHSKLNLPAIAIAQYDKYYPGETARILIGASEVGKKQLEVYQTNQFIIKKETLNKGVEIYNLPITEELRGGVTLRWFGTGNYKFFHSDTKIEVPFDNKKLNITLDVPPTTEPGKEVSWKLSAKSAAGKPINGQASLLVYDKALDYYRSFSHSFGFDNLFPQKMGMADYITSKFLSRFNSNSVSITTLFSEIKFDNSLETPDINLPFFYRGYGRGGRFYTARSSVKAMPQMLKSAKLDTAKGIDIVDDFDLEVAMPVNATLGGFDDSLDLISFDTAAKGIDRSGVSEEDSTQDTIRKNFSETAYFNPILPITNGKANIKFKFPETLTTWNIVGFAITPDVNYGEFNANLITKKDLMLSLQFPRFYREQDKGTIQALITNTSNKDITGTVSLEINDQDTPNLSANILFNLKDKVQTVTIPANSTKTVSWSIHAPVLPSLYTLTAVVRSGSISDGEQKTLPILPNTKRLLASSHIALKNGKNELALQELDNVPSQNVELTTLSIQPSMALSIINAMPNLLNTKYNDLVSSINRYVPLSIVHQFYSTYPQLKEAVKKLPKREGLSASWNTDDPLRLELLSQTPWLRHAKGGITYNQDIINLFDDTIVNNFLTKELSTLEKLQNPSGAFSWIAGGPDSEYLTLYALDAFSQAMHYHVEVPKDMVQKAYSFILQKIDREIEQAKDHNYSIVSQAIYAAYVLSSFPSDWPQAKNAMPYIKKWVEYAVKETKFITPLGQIYLANIYAYLGDTEKSDYYLDRVLNRLKYDKLTGAYFAPEPQSWIWYNDTLSTQTTTLRTLLKLRPNATQIDQMTQWLLFNKQVNEWNNPKTATQAIFSLFDVMQTKNAFNTPTVYTINWGKINKSVKIEPFDVAQKLSFTESAPNITTANYKATINKQGSMIDFASINAIYKAKEANESPKGVINVKREYFVRKVNETSTQLVPLKEGTLLRTSDEVEVHLTLTTDSSFEYVLLQDPKPAGFESVELTSKWDYENISFYKEIRDSVTNFYINWLPHGKVTLHYVLRPSVEGTFHNLPAQIQSMYAPEYGAHSDSYNIQVSK